jgi:hypothetical protein
MPTRCPRFKLGLRPWRAVQLGGIHAKGSTNAEREVDHDTWAGVHDLRSVAARHDRRRVNRLPVRTRDARFDQPTAERVNQRRQECVRQRSGGWHVLQMSGDGVGLGLAHHHRQAPCPAHLLEDDREQWVSGLAAGRWQNRGHAYFHALASCADDHAEPPHALG